MVCSPVWDHGLVADAGAATWGNGTTGIAGSVSAANSLIGSAQWDVVSDFGVTALSNGNYVVRSSFWNNGLLVNAGAVTWANGSTGISGTINAANSLVGSTAHDFIGQMV